MSKSRYSKLMQDLLQNMFEGFVLDENKKLKIVNEAAAQHTADVIHKIVLEKSRELWESFESAEASLRSAAAEINFEELNADVSNMGRQSAGEVSIEDLTNMEGAQTMESTESLKKVLGTDDFDLSSIFESLDNLDSDDPDGDGGDRHLTDEGEGMPMMDAGDEDEELDGDEEFTKLQVGGDDAEMGGDDLEGDMEPDEYGDENGDEMGMDDADELEIEPENGEMDDELGMGDELDGEPMGDEEALDFDFDSLGDLGDEEDEMEEMMGGQMRMESEGDDDDEKDDDDDDDEKDDEKDDDDDKPAFLKDKD